MNTSYEIRPMRPSDRAEARPRSLLLRHRKPRLPLVILLFLLLLPPVLAIAATLAGGLLLRALWHLPGRLLDKAFPPEINPPD